MIQNQLAITNFSASILSTRSTVDNSFISEFFICLTHFDFEHHNHA